MSALSSALSPSRRRGFSPAQWRRLGGFYGVIALLHLAGWGLFLHYSAHYVSLVGLGLTAYMFGLRHAFDADHIAAVDDSVRFLLQKGRRPLGIGFFFSLGHSTVVLGLAVAIVFAAAAVKQELPALRNLGGLIGALEVVNDGLIKVLQMGRSRRGRAQLMQKLQEGRDALAAVRSVLALPENNPASLRQTLSGRRGVAWTSDIELEPVRRQAKRLGVRVNDLMMAALSGAFARQLDGLTLEPEQSLRISVPVNLRPGKGRSMGNHFGLVLLDLPVGEPEPRRRLRLVARRMAELKDSPQAKATLLGLAAAGHLPMPLERKLVASIGAKSVAVVSSLPGPARPVRIAGARMCNLVFWPPQSGGIGLGLSFFSYAGHISFGISADLALLPKPRLLVEAFRAELEQLLALEPLPEPQTQEVLSPEERQPLPASAA